MTITKEQVEALKDFRDAILEQRGALAENGMTGDQINDVLAEFDAHFGALSALEEARPVAWEWRILFGEETSTPGWSEWEKVAPKYPGQRLQERIEEFKDYIRQGFKYELRELYTHPAAPAAAVPEAPAFTDEMLEAAAKQLNTLPTISAHGYTHKMWTGAAKDILEAAFSAAPTSPPAVAEGREVAFESWMRSIPEESFNPTEGETALMRAAFNAGYATPPSVESQDARRMSALQKAKKIFECAPPCGPKGELGAEFSGAWGQFTVYGSSIIELADRCIAAIAAKE